MNRKLSIVPSLLCGFVLVSLALPPNPAQARGFLGGLKKLLNSDSGAGTQELHEVQQGNGSVTRVGDKTVAINSVAVDLTNKGKATIMLRGSGSANLSGSWRSVDKNTISFTFAGGFLQKKTKTQGKGTITLQDGHVERITATGTSGGKNFSVNFQSSSNNYARNSFRNDGGRGNDREGGPVTYSATTSGTGSLTAPGLGDNKFNQIEVKLYSNSAAQLILRASSGGETKMRGSWKQGLFGVYSLSNLEGDGIAGASGSLQKKGDKVSNLTLKGMLNGERFTLSFKAG